jgi:formylglycine-generating enzyme required for sulfatase activity
MIWACLAILAAPAFAETRYALLIGNEDYPAEIGRLRIPHEDVDRMALALEQAGFPRANITVLKDVTQTQTNLAVAQLASRLRAAGSDGVGFFYYSGHGGSAEASGVRQNYLIPAKTPVTGAEQLPVLGVAVTGIIDALAAADAKAVFIVSDACRNTLPFTSSKGGVEDKGMVRVNSRSGLYIAFATADGATAPDDGAFSEALAEQIVRPGQTADRAFTLALRKVASKRSGNRLPFSVDGLKGDICFAGCQAPAIAAAPLLASDENTALAQAMTANTLAAYTAFRDRFPNSANLSFVSAKIAELTPRSVVSEVQRRAGDTFQDTLTGGGKGPEMVVIPAGSFTMGSPSSEEGRGGNEGPQRTVQINYQFAVGKYEVTWAEWEACVADDGCDGSGPAGAGGDEGYGKGNRPVINVDWNDAQAYVQWLSRKTGAKYRLLSEAEWEYAARAGTSNAYWWGGSASHEYANYGADRCCSGLATGRDQWERTSPAGSFPANAFGLQDMHGNVWEWVEDCYGSSYSGAPTDGSARIVSDCSQRVLRGGSWYSYPQFLRSAIRSGLNPTNRNYIIGFRVARTL